MPGPLSKTLDVRFRFTDATGAAALTRQLRLRLGRAIGHWADAFRHVDVRFEDVNGPRGGLDTACTVTVAMKRAAAIVVRARDSTQRRAFALVIPRLERAVRRDLGRRGYTVGHGTSSPGRVRAARTSRKPSARARR